MATKRKSKGAVERGRPRDEAATDEILKHTLLLLGEQGYRGFSLDDVAATAHVSKATVYRRWPSKQALVADAMHTALALVNPVAPCSADVRADLALVLDRSARMLGGSFGKALRALVSEVAFDRALGSALKAVETKRREILRSVVVRARAEGLLSGDVELLVDVLIGAGYFQLLVRQEAPSPKLGSRVARLMLGAG